MARSEAKTVKQYLDELAPERRKALVAVRKIIRKHLPAGFEEAMNYGMITYQVPLKRYPDTYNKQPLCCVAMASQKNYMALYLMDIYMEPAVEKRFRESYHESGKKPDMGKCCVRFRKLEDLPLDLIGEIVGNVTVDNFIRHYEESRRKSK